MNIRFPSDPDGFVPTPMMRYWHEDCGFTEGFYVNRLWRVPDGFDRGRFKAALDTVAAVEPETRLRILADQGRLVRCAIGDECGIGWAAEAARRDADIEAICRSRQRSLLLDGASPLFAFTAIDTPDETLIHFCVHHLAIDGRGIANLVQALETAYGDPDGATPKSPFLNHWSARLYAAAKDETDRLKPRTPPSAKPSAAERAQIARIDAAFDGPFSLASAKAMHVEDPPSEQTEINQRMTLHSIPPVKAAAFFEATRNGHSGFDIFAQAIARAASRIYGITDPEIDVLTACRGTSIIDLRDRICLACELLPLDVPAVRPANIAGALAEQARRRRAGMMDALAWRALRQAADPSARPGFGQAPIGINYRVSLASRFMRDLFGIGEHGAWTGTVLDRRSSPHLLWIDVNESDGGIDLEIEWSDRISGPKDATRFARMVSHEVMEIAVSLKGA